MNKTQKTTFAFIAAAFAASALLYGRMPDLMASHWDIQGAANGYLPKAWALFLMPAVALIIAVIFWLIPKIDPLKANYAKFRGYYENFILFVVAFLLYIHAMTIVWNLNLRFDMTQVIIPAFAVLFYYIGILLEKAKRNWFVGVRTPWTLSSDAVWEKTNRLGAKLFKLFAAASLFGIFAGAGYFFFVVVAMVFASFGLVVYSYFEFRKSAGR